jgi:hypothetical protein
MLATLLGSSSVGFTPPGLLAGLVDQKRREVEKLYRLPDSREDGPWGLRLRYPASEGSYKLGRSIGWRRDSLAVFADLKRASPGSALGLTESIDPQMDVMDAVQKVSVVCGVALWRRTVAWCWRRGVCDRPLAPASPHAVACRLPLPAQVMSRKLDGALVCTDLASYGGSGRDLVSATQFLEASDTRTRTCTCTHIYACACVCMRRGALSSVGVQPRVWSVRSVVHCPVSSASPTGRRLGGGPGAADHRQGPDDRPDPDRAGHLAGCGRSATRGLRRRRRAARANPQPSLTPYP